LRSANSRARQPLIKLSMLNNSISISFSDYAIPDFREAYSNEKWVNYGKDNYYPDYLLSLLRRSPKHGAIIRNKASYIIGKGFKFVEEGPDEELLKSVNKAGESLDKIGKKIAIDLAAYGGFALSVTWSKGKQIVDINHVDFHKVRSDKDNKIFYIKPRGWKNSSSNNEEKPYPAFNPEKPSGTQILYYKEYTPGLDVYPLPEYIQGLNYIEADALISEHTLQNAKVGFTPSKMINFFNGEPTEEQKKEIEKSIVKKYTGEKGSKIIVSFNDDPAKAPQVLDLGTSDLTKEDFQQVDNLIQQNIGAVHNITSWMLFGIRTPGQLGGRSEIIEAYELFKSIYADEKQSAIEEVINMLNSYRGCPDVRIIQKEPIGLDLFGDKKFFDMLPKSFIYEKMGINPDDYPEMKTNISPEAQLVLQSVGSLSPLVANEILNSMTQDEVRSIIGLSPLPKDAVTKGSVNIDKTIKEIDRMESQSQSPEQNEDKKQPPQQQQFSDDETLLQCFSEHGESKSDYIIVKTKNKILLSCEETVKAHEMLAMSEITQTEADIIGLIKKDKRITSEVISKTLNISTKAVEKILDNLEATGLLKTKTEKVGSDKQTIREITKETPKVLEEKKPMTTAVFVKYSYEGPKENRNRDFCSRMLQLDRLYSRADIEQISQRVGYSVWERRGGFYNNPITGETQPFCRHKWVQNIVIKKK
jgi:DNA-binding Lrp family transcriptional regulator